MRKKENLVQVHFYVMVGGPMLPAGALTLWPWSWTFTVQHIIYVKCEYFMNQEG